ncbi:MAG TPA: helix-turn-helix domain-containing protein [Chloroflexota bacterium]|nr:helix-turn-helix domain-containing protein [Chloroflexota bacterium]
METFKAVDHSSCIRFQNAIELIGRRWTGAIIYVLMNGAAGFSEILPQIPELSDRLLSERLKELEDAGVVSREVIPCRPPKVSYELTDKGRSLKPALDAIGTWASDWPAA